MLPRAARRHIGGETHVALCAHAFPLRGERRDVRLLEFFRLHHARILFDALVTGILRREAGAGGQRVGGEKRDGEQKWEQCSHWIHFAFFGAGPEGRSLLMQKSDVSLRMKI